MKQNRVIKRAILSVSDKTGIIEFASELRNLGIEILSTGGTYKMLKSNDLEVKEVSNYTQFPEMMDGRVKRHCIQKYMEEFWVDAALMMK